MAARDHRRWTPWILAAIVALGLVLRLWGIGWGLHNVTIERRPHPDEWVVYWLSRWFTHNHDLNPCPRYPGQCFFDWGTGFPYLAYAVHFITDPVLSAFGLHAFGPAADMQFVRPVLAGRIASALLSTATIAVAFFLGRRTFGEAAGLLAAGLVSLSALLIQLAHFATPDSTTNFLLALTLLALLRAAQRPSTGAFLLAGVLWGLAAGTEYHMILLAAPLAVAWWLCTARRAQLPARRSGQAAVDSPATAVPERAASLLGDASVGAGSAVPALRPEFASTGTLHGDTSVLRPESRGGHGGSRPLLDMVRDAGRFRERWAVMPGGLAPRPIWLLLACLAALATGLLLNAYLLVDWQGFSAAMLHTLRIRTVDSGIQYGNRWAPYQPAWLFVIRYPLGYGVGFAFTAWFLLGLAWSLYRRTRTDLILLAWIVPYWLLVSAEPAKFMRYSAPLLVPLAVLAGRFTLEMVGARLIPAKWPVITLAAAATALTAIYVLAYDGLYGVPDPRQTVAAWITSHSRPGTTVGYEEIPDGVVNLPYFVPKNRLTCIAQYQASHLRGVRYMVLDSYTVEEQPSSEDALMTRFRAYLGRTYHVARVVHDVPTFLGLRFPIDGSPHDWRYADHVMTVYASSRSPVQGRSNPYCFNSVAAASNALYVKPASTGASGSQTG